MTAGLNSRKHARPQARAKAGAGATRAGFTMVEIMFSVLVLGILIGLLIVGARSATKYVKETADKQAVRNLAMAVKEFKREFGFAPPLVKDREFPGVNLMDQTIATKWKIKVFDITVAADELELQDQPSTYDSTDPLADPRWSNLSLATYLAGGLNAEYNGSQNPSSADYITIDGVQGPGFYKPGTDGRFNVPADLFVAGGSKRGVPHESLVNLGGSAIKLNNGADLYSATLTDRNDIPIRYYRWEHYTPVPPAVPNILGDLRVPKIVGRDPAATPAFPLRTTPARDLSVNTELRSAKWAIVAAGANKVFGDEPILELRQKLSMMGDSEEKVREEAEEDNIVEVGQ